LDIDEFTGKALSIQRLSEPLPEQVPDPGTDAM